MKKTLKYLLTAMMFAIVLVGIMSHKAKAQIDPEVKVYLYENGIRVGEVYVPDRTHGQTEYLEHWVLYPNYLYPGPQYIGVLEIVPSPTERAYSSEADFFSHVPFAKGSKYIRVTSQEFASLPR